MQNSLSFRIAMSAPRKTHQANRKVATSTAQLMGWRMVLAAAAAKTRAERINSRYLAMKASKVPIAS